MSGSIPVAITAATGSRRRGDQETRIPTAGIARGRSVRISKSMKSCRTCSTSRSLTSKQRADAAKSGKPFFLYLALPAPHTPIVPIAPFKGASGMNPYADFVMQVDHHMGQLLAPLKEAGIDDNTLVIFTSDNGCSPEGNFEVLKEARPRPECRIPRSQSRHLRGRTSRAIDRPLAGPHRSRDARPRRWPV